MDAYWCWYRVLSVGTEYAMYSGIHGLILGVKKMSLNQILLFQLLFSPLMCCNSNIDSFPKNEIWQAISP